MRVCLILEGCYPYVRGGVSAWAHQYISESRELEFILWTIHASAAELKEPLYVLPDNVVEHHQVILEEAFSRKERTSVPHPAATGQIAALKTLLTPSPQWETLFEVFSGTNESPSALGNQRDFLAMAEELSEQDGHVGVSDAYYGLRSMLLPIMHIIQSAVPEADLYHSAVAGYGGLLGSLAAWKTGKPFILTEHGIYPREREEELMSTDWTKRSLRKLWCKLFYDLSRCAYSHASVVTSLFEGASDRQVLIGCQQDKCRVIANGIKAERFSAIPDSVEKDSINIGAFVRFAAIKDIKTMLYAFGALHHSRPHTHLFLMGGIDDQAYYNECMALISLLQLSDCISIPGYVDNAEYLGKMDFTLITSISEGQPLTILESLAAGRPCVATRVGNCPELLEHANAGLICNPMDVDGIALAMEKLCASSELRRTMGQNGRSMVQAGYTLEKMLDAYHQVYQEVL